MFLSKINWDSLGIVTSIACAIHCALLPLFLTSLPLFGIEIIHNIYFEYGMILLAFIVGAYALQHGYKKHHHIKTPILTFCTGMFFLLAKQIWHKWEIIFLIPAVIFIVWAHYFNYSACKKSNHLHNNDCTHS